MKFVIVGGWVKSATGLDLETFVTEVQLNPSHCHAGPCGHAVLTGQARAALAATVADRWGQAVSVELKQKKVGFCSREDSNPARGAVRVGSVR